MVKTYWKIFGGKFEFNSLTYHSLGNVLINECFIKIICLTDIQTTIDLRKKIWTKNCCILYFFGKTILIQKNLNKQLIFFFYSPLLWDLHVWYRIKGLAFHQAQQFAFFCVSWADFVPEHHRLGAEIFWKKNKLVNLFLSPNLT